MLSGMAEPVKVALAGMGYRVRDYCPVGDVLPGMSYLVRRLLENTSNEGFLRATFNAHVRPESLLRDQAQSSLTTGKTAGLPIKAKENGGIMHHFTNEPLTDFTIADNRRRMKDALQATRKQFDRFYPLVIGGREVRTEREIASINPARPSEIIGRVAKGNRTNADAALEAARTAFPKWSRTTVDDRARLLERTADLLRKERFELAALEAFEAGKKEGKLAFQGHVPPGKGYFIPPTIFTDVSPRARIAQEEIFGPVLCVFKARDLDEALAWANGTEYALIGGFFSRSPGNIERVKNELEAGNVYINRGITGALVARQPFGGFKMSGGGTKAGGRAYLLHFLLPRVVTENEMRRGFAPEETGGG